MRPKIVLLGMMTKMPVAGVVWQNLHYLLGLRRLGFDAYYVESHARTPSMLMETEHDDSSALAAGFIDRVLRRFDLGDRWAYHALHADGRVYGMSSERLRRLYRDAALIVNLHGGTEPLPEHYERNRLIYLETDPVQLQVELHDGLESTIQFLEPHVAFFTFAENLGKPGCRLPVSRRFDFKPTRQPVVTELWMGADADNGAFTTIGNWRQAWRMVDHGGERYSWSKHEEFMKILDLPTRASAQFDLALSSYEEPDRELLEGHGWRVRPALEFSRDADRYRDYVKCSRGEFTVAKDQNVRMQTGWFSDRSATYLASGRPVITQDTGFGSVLPVGEGLFAFSDMDDVVQAVAHVEADYERQRRSAFAIAREFFDADLVLTRLVESVGEEVPRSRAAHHSGALPDDLVLVPHSRRPLKLPEATINAALARPLPPPSIAPTPIPRASIVVVTFDNLALNRLCLESALATTARDVELIVVDNASTDGTLAYLEQLAAREGRVHVIANQSNLGFAPAVNRGLARARGDVLVVLNNDTIVPPQWLERLERRLLDDRTVGLVGPTTNDAGNEAEVETGYATYAEFLEFARKRAIEGANRLVDLPVATMFCTAMRRDVFDRIGYLDEQFEMGLFEDDDYSMRIRDAGYRVVLAEDAFIHHFGEGTFGSLVPTGEHAALFEANRRRFEGKWGVTWCSHERRPARHYRLVVEGVRRAVDAELPRDATLLVVSNGDDELLDLGGRAAQHFPQMPDGTYAGHHPGDSTEAIGHLEELRQGRADYLVVPQPYFWWLDHYFEFARRLEALAGTSIHKDDACVIYALGRTGDPAHDGGRHDAAIPGGGDVS